MNSASPVLFVGLGSPHGDDQIGWRVADALQKHIADWPGISVRKAAVPPDLVDWLEGVQQLHICDAWLSNEPIGVLQRLDARCNSSTDMDAIPELDRLRGGGGTHDFGLVAVLELLTRLHRLPELVVVHAVAARRFEPGNSMSRELTEHLPQITRTILKELTNARDIARAVAAKPG